MLLSAIITLISVPSPSLQQPPPTHPPCSNTVRRSWTCPCTDKHHRRRCHQHRHGQPSQSALSTERRTPTSQAPSYWTADQSAEPQGRRARGRRARGPPSQKRRARERRARERRPRRRQARGPPSQRAARRHTHTHHQPTRTHPHTHTQRAKPHTHAYSQPHPASHQKRELKRSRSGSRYSAVLANGCHAGLAKHRGAQGTLGAPPLRFWGS